MANLKKRMVKLLGTKDVELVEFFFGIQALTTSSMSLIFDHQVDVEILLVLNGLISLPQILAVVFEWLQIRHWSNILTALSSLALSLAILYSNEENNQIAVLGYGGLALACLYCSYRTDVEIHLKKVKDHGTNTDR